MEIDIIIDSFTNCLICSETNKEYDTEFKEIVIDSDQAKKVAKTGLEIRLVYSLQGRL